MRRRWQRSRNSFPKVLALDLRGWVLEGRRSRLSFECRHPWEGSLSENVFLSGRSLRTLRSEFLGSCFFDKVFVHVPLLRRLRFAAVVEQSISPRRGDMFIATSLPPLAPFGGAE